MRNIYGLTYRGKAPNAQGIRAPTIICATADHAQEVADFHNADIPLADRNYVEYDVITMDIEDALVLLYKHSGPGKSIDDQIAAQEQIEGMAAAAVAALATRQTTQAERTYVVTKARVERTKLRDLLSRREVVEATVSLALAREEYEREQGEHGKESVQPGPADIREEPAGGR